MFEYSFRHEDYWMKALHNVYPYDVNGIMLK